MNKKTLKVYITTLIRRIIADDFPGMASEMAYMFVIGIFPLMLLLMSVYGWLGKKTILFQILNTLSAVAPSDAINLLKNVLSEVMIFEHGGLMAIIGFAIVLGLSSNIFAVIMKGLNRAYGLQETRSFIHTRILSVVMLFINTFLLFICTNLIVFGKVILSVILHYIILPNEIIHWILVTRWPVAFIALYVLTFLNYYYLPCIVKHNKYRRRSIFAGTMFFSVAWLLGSWMFSVYLDNLNTYNRVYGTIGAVAILMVWLYYTSIVLLIGGEMNSQVYKKLLIERSNSH